MPEEYKKQTKTAVNPFLKARKAGLEMFSGIRYRMETVAEINGIEFINDSKATDPDSAFCSLEMMQKPVTWIVGTSEFDEDYSVFVKMVKYKVATLVVFGNNDSKIKETLGVFADRYVFAGDPGNAFLYALKYTGKGGVVLFSPACTSFEMFSDYRQRGDWFNKMVNEVK